MLCHSNVTTPVQIGDTENSGYFDLASPVVVTLSWSGFLDTTTQYLGRYEFAGQRWKQNFEGTIKWGMEEDGSFMGRLEMKQNKAAIFLCSPLRETPQAV